MEIEVDDLPAGSPSTSFIPTALDLTASTKRLVTLRFTSASKRARFTSFRAPSTLFSPRKATIRFDVSQAIRLIATFQVSQDV